MTHAYRTGLLLLFSAGLVCLPACGGKRDPRADLKFGQTVRGKVTYGGEAVPYGFVLLYSFEKSLDPTSKNFTPAAVGPIEAGVYEIKNAPLGHMMLCVATDPDLDLGALTKPMRLGEASMPDGAGPPSTGGMPPGPLGDKGAGPDKALKADGKLKLPPGLKLPTAPPNPATARLSDQQKKTLKEIHAKFGEFGKSPLAYIVREGEQTFDIILK